MACSCASSAWMLLALLLVFFASLAPSFSAPTTNHELELQLGKMASEVKNCNETCSSAANITNYKCECLNLTGRVELKQDCAFPRYFVEGIRLYANKSSVINRRHIVMQLEQIKDNTVHLCRWEEDLQLIVSPKTLHRVLKTKLERYNSEK